MRENRGPWYLLTGLALGTIIGVMYAWFVRPVQYTNTSPKTLRADFKDQYRALIASAYLSNGDLVRAKARLDLLGDTDIYAVLAQQAQRTLAEGGSSLEARALGILAVALGRTPPTLPGPTGGPSPGPADFLTPGAVAASGSASPSPVTAESTLEAASAQLTLTVEGESEQATVTPAPSQEDLTPTSRAVRTPTTFPTGTPLPTLTATATPGAPFVLDHQELVCNPTLTTPLIQVETLDAAEQPVPGVEVVVSWENGENHFFTGVKPEVSPGYADFDMTPGITYTLRLADGGQPIPGLTPTECETSGGGRYWGSWSLTFIQP